ncbi:hypothetical protein [Dyadobacter bucti]|uniref:hypothetical protein n=1 Tax=Dyadobacter bucti TaxID=2572203 RepID=UPI003F719AB1
MKKTVFIFILTLALTLLQAVNLPLSAQGHYAKDEPDKGYWQVYTDYRTGNTAIQFFNAAQQLVYKETLSRKYVKLTKRNIRRFDNLLTKLTAGNVLNTSVKTYDLVADSRTTPRDVFRPEAIFAEPTNAHQTSESNVYVVRAVGRLRIILKNPYQEHFDVSIVDDHLRTIHYEGVRKSDYSRWFDLSNLAAGVYKVNVAGQRIRLNYKLTVDSYLGYILENLN